MDKLVRLIKVALVALLTVSPPAAFAGDDSGEVTLRVRIWNGKTFTSFLLERVRNLAAVEDDWSYGIEYSATSRDLNDQMVDEWAHLSATTVRVPVTGYVWHPLEERWQPFSARPGDHPKYPELVYYEFRVSRGALLRAEDPQFAAVVHAPAECVSVYPAPGRKPVDTRTRAANGENELQVLVQDLRNRAININVVLSC